MDPTTNKKKYFFDAYDTLSIMFGVYRLEDLQAYHGDENIEKWFKKIHARLTRAVVEEWVFEGSEQYVDNI